MDYRGMGIMMGYGVEYVEKEKIMEKKYKDMAVF